MGLNPSTTIPIIGVPHRHRAVYFDANIFSSGKVQKLWDWHKTTNPVGSSDDSLRDTIFDGVLLSEYTIDELIVFDAQTPAQINALKKHLALLAILKELPVLRPVVKCLTLPEINSVEPDFRPFLSNEKDQIMGLVVRRLIDLTVGHTSKAVQDIIDAKNGVAKQAQAQPFASPTTLVDVADRIDLDSWITADLSAHNINGKPTLGDFYHLCQRMSEAKRKRAFLPPKGMNAKNFYKPHDHFGEHIDFFHISYAPLVTHFVTDDQAVRNILEALVRTGVLSCKVLDSNEYRSDWIRNRITKPLASS